MPALAPQGPVMELVGALGLGLRVLELGGPLLPYQGGIRDGREAEVGGLGRLGQGEGRDEGQREGERSHGFTAAFHGARSS